MFFLVADLCFVKEVLGHCSCIQTYGCFHCKLKIDAWASPKIQRFETKSIENMKIRGVKVINELGTTLPKEEGGNFSVQ